MPGFKRAKTQNENQSKQKVVNLVKSQNINESSDTYEEGNTETALREFVMA